MSTQRNETVQRTGGDVPRPRIREGGTALLTDQGRTTIADTVVAKIAGIAAREVTGVHSLGAGMTRALGAVRERLSGGTSPTQGVTVEVGERQAAVDIDVIVEYGVSIPDLATGIRRNIISAVENMCGLEVTEVNVSVEDVHIPGEESEPEESRVR
jgi:uncharacterized alkaline shock family protein YloU